MKPKFKITKAILGSKCIKGSLRDNFLRTDISLEGILIRAIKVKSLKSPTLTINLDL
jgi:hypothetical protein